MLKFSKGMLVITALAILTIGFVRWEAWAKVEREHHEALMVECPETVRGTLYENVVCTYADSPEHAQATQTVIVLTREVEMTLDASGYSATATAFPVRVYADGFISIDRYYQAETDTYIYVCHSQGDYVPCSAYPVATPVH